MRVVVASCTRSTTMGAMQKGSALLTWTLIGVSFRSRLLIRDSQNQMRRALRKGTTREKREGQVP